MYFTLQFIIATFLGETLFLPPRMAHAILNMEDNVSVTENFLLHNSLEDLIHALLLGEHALEPSGKDHQLLWKSLYFKQLNKEDRETARSMIRQVESSIENQDEYCY